MSKKEKFYAVKKGHIPGIFKSWSECQKQISHYKGAIYKSFDSMEEAEKFLENDNLDYSSFNENDNDIETYCFVDGSFNEDTNTYGYGGFLIHRNIYENENSKAKIITTEKFIIQGSGNDSDMVLMRNIAGEIKGSMEAIKLAISKGYKSIVVFYDYIGIELWATGQWNRNKNGTKKYYEFIQSIKDKISIKFVKVKGHTSIEGNETADRLAKEACGIIKKKEENTFGDFFSDFMNMPE